MKQIKQGALKNKSGNQLPAKKRDQKKYGFDRRRSAESFRQGHERIGLDLQKAGDLKQKKNPKQNIPYF